MKINHIFLYFTLLLAGVQACEEPDCVSELSSDINVSFYKLNENEQDTVFLNELRAVGIDTALVEDVENVVSFALPANPDTSAVTYVFDTREYGVDTLIVSYTSGARLISEDCGFEQIFSELQVARSDFDSVRVLNKILAEAIDEDIRVYNN